MYGVLDQVVEKSEGEAVEVLNKALGNVRPMVEVKFRRVSGAHIRCRLKCVLIAMALAMRWLVEAARKRGEKREDVHRIAEANKAFSHYH